MTGWPFVVALHPVMVSVTIMTALHALGGGGAIGVPGGYPVVAKSIELNRKVVRATYVGYIELVASGLKHRFPSI